MGRLHPAQSAHPCGPDGVPDGASAEQFAAARLAPALETGDGSTAGRRWNRIALAVTQEVRVSASPCVHPKNAFVLSVGQRRLGERFLQEQMMESNTTSTSTPSTHGFTYVELGSAFQKVPIPFSRGFSASGSTSNRDQGRHSPGNATASFGNYPPPPKKRTPDQQKAFVERIIAEQEAKGLRPMQVVNLERQDDSKVDLRNL
ncbi:hypothetical protein VARIO8X_120068 [Burkholderiales bacterium 8X]|nr:hypothetical protein VARIO8X_120068 [Burkholderiales bacterium 8X]